MSFIGGVIFRGENLICLLGAVWRVSGIVHRRERPVCRSACNRNCSNIRTVGNDLCVVPHTKFSLRFTTKKIIILCRKKTAKSLEKHCIMVYNKVCRSNPIRQDLLTVFTPAVMPNFYIFTGRNAESMKGGYA